MIIVVGSENPAKIAAVKITLRQYPHYALAEVCGLAVASGVPEQPIGLLQIFTGARARAGAARRLFPGADFGVGIESGLLEVPHVETGYMDVCCCAIYDGAMWSFGLSSAFECPPSVIDVVRRGGTLNDGFKEAGITEDKAIGKTLGAIGLLTDGRVDRAAFTQQAVTNAMIRLEKRELFA